MEAKDCCVLIPSLSPDEKLPAYVQSLLSSGYGSILVVDDGSSAEYQEIFERIASWERCVVLHHEVNRGKGAGLKTGFAYIRDHTSFAGILTADSDGQHTCADTLKLTSHLQDDQDTLLLGSRDFSAGNPNIPKKSRMGNRITSFVFRALYGPSLPDTQTGLRAFPRSLIPFMLGISGDRFEYEMNMLIKCAVQKVKMTAVPIETVYIEENKSSHFHPFRDSYRIYKLLLGNFFKFMGSSILCFLVDQLLFWLLDTIILPAATPLREIISTYGARICSATLNFNLNKKFVFDLRSCKGAVWRYILLCVGVALVSGCIVEGFSLILPRVNSLFFKIPVDFLLYFVNYRVQKEWVFREKAK